MSKLRAPAVTEATRALVQTGERVRVTAPVGDIPAGSEGVVCGFYRVETGDLVVLRIGGASSEVPLALVEPVDP